MLLWDIFHWGLSLKFPLAGLKLYPEIPKRVLAMCQHAGMPTSSLAGVSLPMRLPDECIADCFIVCCFCFIWVHLLNFLDLCIHIHCKMRIALSCCLNLFATNLCSLLGWHLFVWVVAVFYFSYFSCLWLLLAAHVLLQILVFFSSVSSCCFSSNSKLHFSKWLVFVLLAFWIDIR